MYPSLIMLGWMSIVCCVLPSGGRLESASVLASVLAAWAAMASQAGLIEAGDGWKRGKDLVLQLVAAAAFLARLALHAAALL